MSNRLKVGIAAVACATVACAAFACAPLRAHDAGPHIDTIAPDSINFPAGAVVEVVVYGRGFVPGTPGQNTVRFGDVRLTSVPGSIDGTRIRFVVPDRLEAHGDAAPLPLESGQYPVRIETPSGTSNSVTLRVAR